MLAICAKPFASETPAHPDLQFMNYDLQFTNYDLLLFFSVADDLFVGMLVKGSFTVKYGRGVYILHYEEQIAPYFKVHEIT